MIQLLIRVIGKTIQLLVYFKKIKDYSYEVKIVDTKKPTIEAEDSISVVVGDEIDLLSLVKVTDNSKEEITAKVEGEYDLNKEGSHGLGLYIIKTLRRSLGCASATWSASVNC